MSTHAWCTCRRFRVQQLNLCRTAVAAHRVHDYAAELFKAHLQKTAMQEPPADGEAFVVTKELVDDFVAQIGSSRAAFS